MLAPYAVRAEQSRGRRYAEPAHPYRNEFQRDRDRVVHARAFRRLEDKTQVFTRRYSDHFRNRLTHTIEVAQIARTIAAPLGLNADLVEALALVHDIGHPPFGHAGERALDAAMRAHGSFFDHNLHALRIVEDFELRYIGFRGLNLTFEVREGIIKHSHDYSADEHPEIAEYLLDERPPLESQLIDWADEIAYNAADLDDGFEARILAIGPIRQRVALFDRFYRRVEVEHPQAPVKLRFNAALKAMIDYFVTDLIENTARRIRAAGVASLDEVRACRERLVAFSDAAAAERAQCKQFLYQSLYFSPELEAEKQNAERIVAELFEHCLKHPEVLPAAYRQRASRSGLATLGVGAVEAGKHGESGARKEVEPLVRVTCDYIAGMTDSFIQLQHARAWGGGQ